MSRIDGPESDGAGSDEQALIGKGKRPLQHSCWGWSRYAICSGDPPTSNLVESIIKRVDFQQKTSSSKPVTALSQGPSIGGQGLETRSSLPQLIRYRPRIAGRGDGRAVDVGRDPERCRSAGLNCVYYPQFSMACRLLLYCLIDQGRRVDVVAADVLQHLHCDTETALPERAIDMCPGGVCAAFACDSRVQWRVHCSSLRVCATERSHRADSRIGTIAGIGVSGR